MCGFYGKIPGKVSTELKKIIDSKKYIEDKPNDTKYFIDKFKEFCKKHSLPDLYKDQCHLLNFILFKKEAQDYYLSSDKNSTNEIIGLQEGFGLYIND